MSLDLKLLTFIIFITIGIFFIDNEYWGGYLGSSDHGLQHEIASPKEALYEWKLADKPPFKYRILFPAIVKGSWKLLPEDLRSNEAFYVLYKTWSLFFLVTSVVAFFFLLRILGFSEVWTFAACMIYVASPPILLAYSLPVHTREDTLAYTLLCAGLACLVKNRIFAFLLVSICGVFCRETLLLLPFVFMFFHSYRTFMHRALLAALPVVTWIAIRILLRGEAYDPWEGLKWNIDNPLQVIGFTFITFGFMWPLFLYGLFRKEALLTYSDNKVMSLIYRSGWAVLLLIMVTTFIGGIYNEIRLLFLMFPWVIGISVHILGIYKSTVFSIWKSKRYITYAVICTLLFLVLSILCVNDIEKYFEESVYNIRFDVWIIMTFFSMLMTALFIPIFFRIFTRPPYIGDKFADPLS